MARQQRGASIVHARDWGHVPFSAMPGEDFEGGTWVALISSGAPWSTDERRVTAAHRLVSVIEILALAITLTIVWRATGERVSGGLLPALTATIATIVLLVDPVLRMLGRPPFSRDLLFNLILHGGMIAVVALALFAVLPGWSAVFSASLGIALGADAALTAVDLDWDAQPLRWWIEFLVSPFHAGVLAALAVVIASRGRDILDRIWPMLVAVHVCVAVTVLVAWGLGRILRHIRGDQAEVLSTYVADERRRRAHWLHDDVCAQLRLVSLKVQTEATTPDQVVRLLDGLDHMLRLRQLDELLGSGTVRVAEVLQPYLRNAQNLGATIGAVPAYDQAAFALGETHARLLSRAASLLISNALNAGATELSFDVATEADQLALTVSDNGPGLTEGQIQPGRGLWNLREELHPGSLDVLEGDRGGTVRVVIALTERSGRVDNPVGG
jgi:signal transduction histidine kinase